MQTIQWEAEGLSGIIVHRHCKKCGAKREFQSSGAFRVNANRRRLDIWLIYRCIHCGGRWNLAIYTRVSPESLPPAQLAAFTANDPALAGKYAGDEPLLRKNGAETTLPPCRLTGPDLPRGERVHLVIRAARPWPVRLGKLLQGRLGYSAREMKAFIAAGGLGPEGAVLARRRLGEGAELDITLPGESKARPPPAPVLYCQPEGPAACLLRGLLAVYAPAGHPSCVRAGRVVIREQGFRCLPQFHIHQWPAAGALLLQRILRWKNWAVPAWRQTPSRAVAWTRLPAATIPAWTRRPVCFQKPGKVQRPGAGRMRAGRLAHCLRAAAGWWIRWFGRSPPAAVSWRRLK